MKRFFIALLVTLMSVATFAQTESPHLSFKGVPIDGTLNEYIQKMKQKGFDYIGQEGGLAVLTGDFAAYNGCTIGVSTLNQKDLVSSIAVFFPYCSTWASLSNNYYSLKEMLTEKYGKPVDVIEEFQGNHEPTDDGSRMYAVKFDRCKYVTIFETPKGNITLNIAHNGITDCFVSLVYLDKINGELVRAKAMDDL